MSFIVMLREGVRDGLLVKLRIQSLGFELIDLCVRRFQCWNSITSDYSRSHYVYDEDVRWNGPRGHETTRPYNTDTTRIFDGILYDTISTASGL